MRVRNELIAGFFVAAALLLFILSIFVIGRERQIFASQVEYTTTFQDVKGLSVGAPVRLGGITIGRVSEIDFAKNPNDPKVYAKMLINDKYIDRLRSDAQIMLETQGLLGDRFLAISTGNSNKALQSGATLASKESGDLTAMYDKVKGLIEKTSTVADDLKEISEKVKNDSLPNIIAVTADFAEFAKALNKGDGPITHLIKEKDGKQTIDELRVAIKNFKEFSDSLKVVSNALSQGTGTIGALLLDPSIYNNLVEITDGAKRSFILRQAVRATLK